MTSSQIITTAGLIATTVSGVAMKILPILDSFPTLQKYGPYVALTGIFAGIFTSSFNQSLSGNHVSVPKRKAKAIAEGKVPSAALEKYLPEDSQPEPPKHFKMDAGTKR